VHHFMDDDHQLSIGVSKILWPVLQEMANREAQCSRWLGGLGSDWEYLNIWIIRRLADRPDGVEPWQWITRTAQT